MFSHINWTNYFMRRELLELLCANIYHISNGDRAMSELYISRDEILQSTLFHIQIKRCQYIDDFPEIVTNVFSNVIKGKKLLPYEKIKRKLYRLNTSFFEINKAIQKREFYQGLYKRIKDKT